MPRGGNGNSQQTNEFPGIPTPKDSKLDSHAPWHPTPSLFFQASGLDWELAEAVPCVEHSDEIVDVPPKRGVEDATWGPKYARVLCRILQAFGIGSTIVATHIPVVTKEIREHRVVRFEQT